MQRPWSNGASGWAEHHASESKVWLIFYKQHTGVAAIDYKDALDEAMCFGWVDSLFKRLDERRYARKFTPRRADSRWSAINRVLRIAQSIKEPPLLWEEAASPSTSVL